MNLTTFVHVQFVYYEVIKRKNSIALIQSNSNKINKA